MSKGTEIAKLNGQIAAMEKTKMSRKSDNHPDGWLHQSEKNQLADYKKRLAQLKS